MTKHSLLQTILAAAAAAGLSSCASTQSVDAKTDAVLSAMSEKLAAAKTVRVTATRTASPGFTAGVEVAQTATGTIAVQRPNKLAARMNTSSGRRAVGFDGSRLTVVDYAAGTHSTAEAPGDIDSAARGIQTVYGVTPPVGELLVNHPKRHLLSGVKTGRHAGTESVNGVECDRLTFTQDGLSWQLWVATGDKLPRRIAYSYPNGEGGAPLEVKATITKWELDAPLTDADVTVQIPSGSSELKMIPLRE